MTTLWFDMDGTIANLYGVENWLPKLQAHDETPYAEAKPIVNMNVLARLMNRVQRNGYRICIVTALAKDSNADYDERVINAKKKWLHIHLKSVQFDEVRFVSYATVKNDVNDGNDYLFDDEERHLKNWTGKAIHATEMLQTLKALAA